MNEEIIKSLTQEELEMFLAEISEPKYQGLREGLAMMSTDERILRILSADNKLASQIASNPSTPKDILRALSIHAIDEDDRIEAIINPSIDKSLTKAYLKDLAKNGNPEQKKAVAANPATPLGVLRKLCKERR